MIKAKMLRETIAMTLYQGKHKPSKTLFVTEEWHKNPSARQGRLRAPKPKAWKFSLSTSEKIAFVGVTISGIGLLIAGLNQFNRTPPQPASPEEQPVETSGESGQANAT